VSGTAASEPLLVDCGRQQIRVIGALIIREMHTRFGHHRLGYLSLFVEPLILGGMISLIHGSAFGGDNLRNTFEFFSIGYVIFFAFRGMVSRAPATIGSNRGLLYHRQVTLPDLFYARHIIEAVSCVGVVTIFSVVAIAFGGEVPAAPIKMLSAVVLMVLLSQGIALVVGAATTEWEGLERIVHAATYIMLPIGGVFFMVDWLPEWSQQALLWVPTVSLFELLREGQFGDRVIAHYDLGYVWSWILISHLLGLSGLRLIRNRLGLD